MTTPANLPNQVGVQGIQALLALWISRAANAVNWLLQGKAVAHGTFVTGGYSLISTTDVMLGSGLTITPLTTGRVLVLYTGVWTPSVTLLFSSHINYGTGAAPALGAAVTGTAISITNTPTSTNSAEYLYIAQNGYVANLAPGTTYWIDVAAHVSTGTASIAQYEMSAWEV